MYKKEKKTGFTLAETLITLVIIGVVAAITLPNIIIKHQKEETAVKIKKAYSEINQAIRSAEITEGTIDTWDLSNFEDATDRNTFFAENYLFPNIKIMKKCIPSNNECWADITYNLDGESAYLSNHIGVSFITVSGYSVGYWINGYGGGGWFFADINGPATGPNRLGRDIFAFFMNWGNRNFAKGFYPAGLSFLPTPTRDDLINGTGEGITNSNTTAYKCKKNAGASNSGAFCTAVIALDKWSIADDYPW